MTAPLGSELESETVQQIASGLRRPFDELAPRQQRRNLPRSISWSHSRGDAALGWSVRIPAALVAGLVALISIFVVRESLDALREIGLWRFLSDASWHPAGPSAEGTYNLVPMLAGSVLVTLGSLCVAGPLGVLSAVFCQYYAPRPVAGAYRQILGLLAGIPSVVYGFWGLVVLVPLIQRVAPPGPSLLAGILVLSLMVLPTMALLTDSALQAVPAAYLRGAAALGMSKVATVIWIALPAARSGLLTGAMLSAGRALGETMAILMVCGNVVALPRSVFDPMRTLTANIALEMAYALGIHRSALFMSGLVLLVLLFAMIGLAGRIGRKALHV
jgi:phosphate transport system permease protein